MLTVAKKGNIIDIQGQKGNWLGGGIMPCSNIHNKSLEDENKKLQAENERLKMLLQQIKKIIIQCSN
jgi:pantothenate kinase type III